MNSTQNKATVLVERSVLRVFGPGATNFLQGLVSNDMALVGPDTCVYAALLTPQGRFRYEFFISADPTTVAGEGFLLEGEKSRQPELIADLMRYRLRARVTFEDMSDHFVVQVMDGAAAAFGLPNTPGVSRRLDDGRIAMVDPRLAALGVRLLVPPEMSEAKTEDDADYDRLRLILGVPDGSRDLGVNKTLALEGNLDFLNAISWTKGCYVGQEVTARTRYRALVRRRLRPVRGLRNLPPFGTVLTLDGAPVGELCSGRGDLGLAMIRLETLPNPAHFMAEGVPVSLLTPGWETL